MYSSYSYNHIWHNVEDERNISCLEHYSIKISLREGHLFGRTVCMCVHICNFFSLPYCIRHAMRLWEVNWVLL